MKKSEYIQRYGEEAYQQHLDKRKQYYQQRYQQNKEELIEYQKQYNQQNKEEIREYKKQYLQTPMGRANSLISAYKASDKLYNRGECTLTSDWIVNNIFNSKCVYCGESDWKHLGCDRIDNSKPHTEDNVVCCCGKCNIERQRMPFEEFLELKKLQTS